MPFRSGISCTSHGKSLPARFLMVAALFMLGLGLVLLLKRPQPGIKIEGAH